MRKIICNIRVIIALIILLAIGIPFIKNYVIKENLRLPDEISVDFTQWDDGADIELDNYILTFPEEMKSYDRAYVVNKGKNISKLLFDDVFENKQYRFISNLITHEDTVYYAERDMIYAYDLKTNQKTLLIDTRNHSKRVEVFDVTVFKKTVSREELEESLSRFAVARGKLLIVSTKRIYLYDGVNRDVLLRGEYALLKYKDGIAILSHSTYDDQMRVVTETYELNVDDGKLKLIDSEVAE